MSKQPTNSTAEQHFYFVFMYSQMLTRQSFADVLSQHKSICFYMLLLNVRRQTRQRLVVVGKAAFEVRSSSHYERVGEQPGTELLLRLVQ